MASKSKEIEKQISGELDKKGAISVSKGCLCQKVMITCKKKNLGKAADFCSALKKIGRQPGHKLIKNGSEIRRLVRV